MIVESRRKVVTRSPHRRVGYIFCPWIQAHEIEYESLLERDFVRVALLCPGLTRITSQPFTLQLDDGSKYTPDFELEFGGTTKVVVEVKPSAHLAKYSGVFHQASQILERLKYCFIVSTEREIQPLGRSRRAGVVLRSARRTSDLEGVRRALTALPTLEWPNSLPNVCESLCLSPEMVMYLIGRQHLRVSADLSLNFLELGFSLEDKNHGYISPSSWLGSAF